MNDKQTEELKEKLKSLLGQYLEKLGIKGHKNFNCLNPEHEDSTPSMKYFSDTNKVYCYGCGASYDLLDLIAIDNNIPNTKGENLYKVLKLTCKEMGVEYPEEQEQSYVLPKGFTKTITNKKEMAPAPATTAESEAQAPASTEQEPQAPQEDYTSFLLEAHKHAGETDYFKSRGLTQESIDHFKLGFCPAWVHPKPKAEGKKITPKPCIIVPVNKYCYFARDTRKAEDIPDWQKGKEKQKAGDGKQLYNIKNALAHHTSTIIVVEGELDAVSIWQAGGNPLGLRSTNNYRVLIELIRKNPAKKWVLALDNDSAGHDTSKKIVEALANDKDEKGYKIIYQLFIVNLYKKYKDANETLQKEPYFLSEIVEAIMSNPAKVAYEHGNSDAGTLAEFYENVKDPAFTRCYSTGFSKLDRALGGGLYSGLYLLGAITGLGKTTLILQIANNLAKQGYDVLFFSLEMGKNELIARSISKLTSIIAYDKNQSRAKASTQLEIMCGSLYPTYSEEKRAIIRQAYEEYRGIANHIYTIEGNFNYTIEDIERRIQQHIMATGTRPIVFVDYLQILSIDDEQPSKTGGRPRNYTDKQKADRIVSTLKRMSRNLNTPVLVVSSFNRDNYTQPVSQASFKESGGLEYSCDVMIGLQYTGMEYTEDEINPAIRSKVQPRAIRIANLVDTIKERIREGRPAPIHLKILKNRRDVPQSAYFNYYPAYNYFEETTPPPKGKTL